MMMYHRCYGRMGESTVEAMLERGEGYLPSPEQREMLDNIYCFDEVTDRIWDTARLADKGTVGNETRFIYWLVLLPGPSHIETVDEDVRRMEGDIKALRSGIGYGLGRRDVAREVHNIARLMRFKGRPDLAEQVIKLEAELVGLCRRD